MKIWILLTIILNGSVHAQQNIESIVDIKTPSVYIGLGSGINDVGFMGGILETPLNSKISIFGNAGMGFWGYKIGAGICYYPNSTPYKTGLSLGYSIASGFLDFEQELRVEPNDAEQEVVLNLSKARTINLLYSYNIKIGKKSKLIVNCGYAIPITNKPWEVKTTGVELTEYSEQFLTFMQPGGINFGLKFMLGI